MFDEDISHKSAVEGGADNPLPDHLRDVARRARGFADAFGCGVWGEVAGLLHDLGKFNPAFQRYIRKPDDEKRRGEVNHSSPGAIYAAEEEYPDKRGRWLAYLIAGHHAGLPDWTGGQHRRACLDHRLEKGGHWLEETMENERAKEFLASCDELQNLAFPPDLPGNRLAPSLRLRMLFSCLVDADFLVTERFMDGGKADSRGDYPKLGALKTKFEKHVRQFRTESGELNRLRADVQEQCAQKGRDWECGIYTLTVPTGGGKTLASMRFALEHAAAHGKQRIIYAIPFTSIIEQTAEVFRKIDGWNDAVVEHHSNIVHEPEKKGDDGKVEEEDLDSRAYKQRLASENWDAPVVVTTNVQFFESLFAAKTSRCRKLHNIVNSVVILDEAQALPPAFLEPILSVITELHRRYNVTFVLCTATQPALGVAAQAGKMKGGFVPNGEIAPEPRNLAEKLTKRVKVCVPEDFNEARSWEDIADAMAQTPQALCIVNTKAECRELYAQLREATGGDDAAVMHLSTNMCGAHRARKIGEMRERLDKGAPIRVVSTSLIEAGVDVDFPVVYRAIIGLDSIAQAAGRCNREGKLAEGIVQVFVPPNRLPPEGLMLKGWQAARQILEESAREELLLPDKMEAYFNRFYGGEVSGFDKENIMPLLDDPDEPDDFSFRTAAEKFVLIKDGGTPVVVPYRDSKGCAMDILRRGLDDKGEVKKGTLRKLQRYTVNLHEKQLEIMLDNHEIEREILERSGIYVLQEGAASEGRGNYCDNIGLNIPDGLFRHETLY